MKYELIIETDEQYPRTVCLICWTNQVEEAQKFAPGQIIKAQIEISSRQFNGKWYTDVRVWRFEPVVASTTPSVTADQPAQQPVHQTPPAATEQEYFTPAGDDSVDDLPF